MTKEHYTRWMCFVEIFHILEERGVKKKLPADIHATVFDSRAIHNYIDERFPSILNKLEREGFDRELVKA